VSNVGLGSKLHPDSKMYGKSLLRSIATFVFIILKKIFIPIKLPLDTQGIIFIKTTATKGSLEECKIDGFFDRINYIFYIKGLYILRGASDLFCQRI